MPEEILYITFIAMVAVIMVNIVCAIDHKRAKNLYKKYYEMYLELIRDWKHKLWKNIGAYEAPEKGQLYLDLEGGLRLVIFEGKVDGWYEP